ncbi:MAG: ADP-ribosylation factor-like protein [Promethearchaeota archaeon]
MSEWVSDAELAAKLGYKILIAGLSEAGKTAVKRIFFLKQRAEDVDSLSATINYERMSITIRDTPITIMDLGGQKVFLKRFLSGFSPFVFSSVKIFIFLIDVANKTSRNNAIEYFKACLEKINTYSPHTETFVFLHKNDLLVDSPNYESIHEQLKEQLQLEYPKGPLKFFRTTIYRPESVINAFGRIIELVIPEISKSEFVEGREIGEIEEFHETGMTLRRPSAVVANQPVETITPKMAGDPAILSKLQRLMESAVKTDPEALSQGGIFLGNAAEEESISETTLTHVDVSPQPYADEFVGQDSVLTPTKHKEHIISVVNEEKLVEKRESVQINPRISYFVDFFRIEPDKATEIVESGYDIIFETAAKIGIEIPLLLDVFFKYLPFIKKSQGDKKYKNITDDKLLQLFGAYLKSRLKEEDFVKCLVFIAEKPKMSIEEILEKYLIPEKMKKKKKEAVEEIVEEKPVELTEVDIPVEAETNNGIIAIPNIKGLGFKIDLVDEGLNAIISFHFLGLVGQTELIGSAKVSSKITSDEILYLLAYELNMQNMGFFEEGLGSMHFATKIIHESLRQLQKKTLKSTSEVTTKRSRKEQGYLTETVNFIIPMQIEVDTNYLMLPDSEQLAFTVYKAKKGVLIDFVQRGFPIAQVNVVESIKIDQLKRLLKEAIQLPIDKDGALDFAARVIQETIKKVIESESEGIRPKEVLKPEFEVVEDQTSRELKEYLALLEKDLD